MVEFKAQMQTKGGTRFKSAIASRDLERFFSTGLFSDADIKFEKDEVSQLALTFMLTDNPVITSINIENASVYPKETIVSRLKSKVGEVLNLNNIRRDVALIEKDLYDTDGYILARVGKVEKPEKANKHILTFYLDEGLIESVEIEDNFQTADYVILRELNLKAGSVFNKDTLIADLRRLYNLNYFASIVPRYEPSPRDPNKVILIITVEEKSTNTVNFGGGWGAQQGGFAFFDVQLGNFLGTGQLVSAKAQLGDTSTYQLKYHNPWMWEDRTSLTSRYWLTTGRPVGIEGVENTGTNEKRYGFDVAIGKELFPNIVGKLTLLNEDVAPSNNESYNIRSIGLSLAYDTRDSWTDPSSGVYYVAGLEEAGRFLNGTVSYTRWRGELNSFYKVAEGQTIAQRLSWAKQSGDIKETEEFWMGGPNTVRGFQAGEYFSRGREKLVFNVEYRYRFNEAFQGVLFYDIGNAWDTGVGFVNSRRYRSGYGFGARVATPLGPIRLDYGIADDRTTGRGIIHFSMGHVF